MNLKILPEEIVIKIFSLIPPEDLLNSTTVCKLFNEIISNSFKLLKAFEITLSSSTAGNIKHIGDRKYSRFKIIGDIDAAVLEKLNKKSIFELKIEKFNGNFEKIFTDCKNLQKISFKNCKFVDTGTAENHQKLNIQNFILISSDLKILNSFKNSTIKNLFIKDSKSCDFNVVSSVTNFENLTIYRPELSNFASKLSNLKIPSVKKLKLVNLNFQDSTSLPFDVNSINVDELILEHVGNCADFLIQLLMKESTKLKLLRSIGIAYDGVTCWIVRQNRRKIEKLESNFKVTEGTVALSVSKYVDKKLFMDDW